MYTELRRRSLSGWKARHKILENEYFGRRIRTGRLIRLLQERFWVRDLKALFLQYSPLRTAKTCAIICSNIQLFYFCKFEQMSRIENSGSEPFIRDRRII